MTVIPGRRRGRPPKGCECHIIKRLCATCKKNIILRETHQKPVILRVYTAPPATKEGIIEVDRRGREVRR